MRNIAFRVGLFVAICFAAPTASRASSVYVAAVPGELAAAAKVAVAAPAPVQLVISFTTNGAPNAEATAYAKPIVIEAVKASGVFSTISEIPVESGGSLTIVFNNTEEKGAVEKGVVLGLSFGLVGALATDRIVAEFAYTPAGISEPITASVDHAIITKFGNKKAPDGAVKVKDLDEAGRTVFRQSVDHGLNRIAADPRFAAATAGANPAAPPASHEQAAQR